MMTNLFLSVLGGSVSTSLIVAVLILLTSILNKRYAAKWKYLMWIFLALRLLVPFSGTNGGPVIEMLPQRNPLAALEHENSHGDALPNRTAPRRVIVELPTQMTAPLALQSPKSNIRITLLDIMAFIWMIGCLAFLSVHLFSYLHYRRQLMKKGAAIKDTRILCQIAKLKQELHITCAIQAVEEPEAASPMIIGFLKPVLVLPKEQYRSDELLFILKHELVHLKRGDVYVKLLFVAANAVHWFNPLIWVMQKEAAVDMELACDERVIQGANYAVRKAYTETLLSMLHKRCTKKTVLSTQFYGGKKIMKKRFRNILVKNGKKNGIFLLICAIILTVSLGTLVGCQVAKEIPGERYPIKELEPAGQEMKPQEGAAGQTENEDSGEAPGQTGNEDSGEATGQTGNEILLSAGNNRLENAMTFSFSKEGETEEKQASLVIGDGYSIYLPDNEWRQSDSDVWTAAANEQVLLWVTHFEGAAIREAEEELADNGYGAAEHGMMKQDGNMIYIVKLNAAENDVWGVHYCYPAEAEEGWGRELPMIADTFAVSVSADDGQAHYNGSTLGRGNQASVD